MRRLAGTGWALLGLWLTALGSPGAPAPIPSGSLAALPGPRMVFDALTNDFGKVMSGEEVKHIFYFTNAGSEDLVVSSVQPGCGCTVVENWTREVKPGGWGQIPVTLNTARFNDAVVKQVAVVCNDPGAPRGLFQLSLKGVIWRPVEVSPPQVSLLLTPDVRWGAGTVQIRNNLDEPLVLSAPVSSDPRIGAVLTTNTLGREYQVAISNAVMLPLGVNLNAQVTLKTSVAKAPAIEIQVFANQQAPLLIYPRSIPLKAGRATTNQVAYVTIVNNSTNPIALTEAKVEPGPVEVTVTATRPGRYFTILLKFPPGYALAGGRPGEFSVKTTNPTKPLVTVPIYPAPAGAQVPAARKSPPSGVGARAVAHRPRPVARPMAVAVGGASTNGIRLARPPAPDSATASPGPGAGEAAGPMPVIAVRGRAGTTNVPAAAGAPVAR